MNKIFKNKKHPRKPKCQRSLPSHWPRTHPARAPPTVRRGRVGAQSRRQLQGPWLAQLPAPNPVGPHRGSCPGPGPRTGRRGTHAEGGSAPARAGGGGAGRGPARTSFLLVRTGLLLGVPLPGCKPSLRTSLSHSDTEAPGVHRFRATAVLTQAARPAAHRPHAAQGGRERSPTQNPTVT